MDLSVLKKTRSEKKTALTIWNKQINECEITTSHLTKCPQVFCNAETVPGTRCFGFNRFDMNVFAHYLILQYFCQLVSPVGQ